MGLTNSKCKTCKHDHKEHTVNGCEDHPKLYNNCSKCGHSTSLTKTKGKYSYCIYEIGIEAHVIAEQSAKEFGDIGTCYRDQLVVKYCSCTHDDHKQKPKVDYTKVCEIQCKKCTCEQCLKTNKS